MSKFKLALVGALTLVIPCNAAEFEPMALNGFSFVPNQLRAAVVHDENGNAIGIVQRVEADGSGKPRSLEIMSPGGHKYQIPAGQASYDPEANVVIADDARIATADARPLILKTRP